MVKGKLFIAIIVIECFALFALYVHGSAVQQSNRTAELQAKKELVTRLGLTDFAIWTEARYTRILHKQISFLLFRISLAHWIIFQQAQLLLRVMFRQEKCSDKAFKNT